MNIIKNLSLLNLPIVLIALIGCNAGSVEYPVLDSGFPAADQQVYWLDDDKVIFVGYKAGEFTDLEKVGNGGVGKQIHTGIFVWDIKQNTVKKYADSSKYLCYHNGYIAYSLPTQQSQKSVIKAGQMGKEEVVEFKQNPEHIEINPFTCKYFDYDPSITANRLIKPLLDEHGYLDYGPRLGTESVMNTPIVFHGSENKDTITLPVDRRELDKIVYYPFKNAYFLQGPYFDAAKKVALWPWPENIKQTVWWLYPNGKVVATTFSYEPWKPSTPWFYPTKKGLFMGSGNAKSYTNEGTTGGYLFVSNEFDKLISGYINGIAVSPNGCKVAFVHVPSLAAKAESWKALAAGKSGKHTLKMLDLCR